MTQHRVTKGDVSKKGVNSLRDLFMESHPTYTINVHQLFERNSSLFPHHSPNNLIHAF